MSSISAKIIADSVSNITDTRITTMELEYHRFIHSEFMTHRMFSRNASSSRAIPVKKLLEQVREDPMLPIYWGSNQPGMQAGEELCQEDLKDAKTVWLKMAREASKSAALLMQFGLHKQVTNRLLEPFLSIKVVVTATEWENFFHLRDHKDAQPEIRELAVRMREALEASEPEVLQPGEWHLPYINRDELGILDTEDAIRASAARCARVSYLNHDKSKCTLKGDLDLFNMLSVRPFDDGKGHVLNKSDPVHLSPLEHQATPMSYMGMEDPYYEAITHEDMDETLWSGNFRDWIQFRQTV